MKFLLDHDVPEDLSYLLRELGHEVLRLRDVLPLETPDPLVLQFACNRRHECPEQAADGSRTRDGRRFGRRQSIVLPWTIAPARSCKTASFLNEARSAISS